MHDILTIYTSTHAVHAYMCAWLRSKNVYLDSVSPSVTLHYYRCFYITLMALTTLDVCLSSYYCRDFGINYAFEWYYTLWIHTYLHKFPPLL